MVRKYALKAENENVIEKSPYEMHERMAAEFARIEEKYAGENRLSKTKILDLFNKFGKIIPQGSVMALLGNNNQIGSLSNCIVTPKIHDSYGGILYTDQQLVQLMKRRCGVGLDISSLRPSGSTVSNAAQSSTGAVSFMSRFSNSTREVAQDGRRGALMISMDIRHPDIEIFINSKQDLSKVTGANISVRLTDAFMEAVESESKFIHTFPIDTTDNPKEVDALPLWNTLIKAAHNTAEPGLLFWDKHHIYSPSSIYKEFENQSVNPCAEISMGNDSCRLISVNMFSCVENPFKKDSWFNLSKWHKICYDNIRLMDDLVDLELEKIDNILSKINNDKEPDYIKEVERKTWIDLYSTGLRGRRTGAGFTALGDTLAALGYKYDSAYSLSMIEQIMRSKFSAELESTIDLAVERGAFQAFDAKLEEEWSNKEGSFFYMIKNEISGIMDENAKIW